MSTFYLTTPIYYPNARPHVGSAYTTIVCDVLARYKRMCGYDVAFLTGTDEHGEKLERAAAAAGKSPSDFVTEKRQLFIELWEKLGMPVSVYPDGGRESLRFIYTTHPDHEKSVRRMLLLAKEKGYIAKRTYAGRYCVHDERYISDGSEPADCDVCGRPAELISEENYFFKLSEFGGEDGPLMRLYRDNPGFVQPAYRMNEVTSFVKSGLRDISVSRKRIKWGIPFPLDADRDDPEQVVYVWYDALTSYLTGIGCAQGENGGPDFQKYWMGAEGPAEVVHMIGKDILRFHAVYWPAFLMAANLPLPKTIFAHGWIYYEQDKMSKSKGNVVYPEPIVDAFDSFGAPGNDALRYYLLREAPFGQDMSFSYDGLIHRYNSDLANDLGNLASRTIAMIGSYFGGKVPEPSAVPDLQLLIDRMKDSAIAACNDFSANFENYDLSRGLESVWKFVGAANSFLVQTGPWLRAKRDLDAERANIAAILYCAAEALRFAAVLLCPVIPTAAARIWQQLGCEGRVDDKWLELDSEGQVKLKWGQLKPGAEVGKPEPVFPAFKNEKKELVLAKLYELAEADRKRDKPKEALKSVQTEKNNEAAPVLGHEQTTVSPEPPAPGSAPVAEPEKISIEDFAKVEMRVGEVKAAEHVPGATKLLKLMVDIGTEIRQVVAGLAEAYEPESLIGMKVAVVTNLQPRKLRGVESNGMIIAASEEHGRPVLVTFKDDIANGARLK